MSISVPIDRARRGHVAGRAAAALILLSAITAPLGAQDQAIKDAGDVAKTPLEDLGIMGDDIPEVLAKATRDPYAAKGLTTCKALVEEIAALDQVLGADYDIAEAKDGGIDTKGAAKSVVGSIIPFRGLVREVSGAAGDQRKALEAVTAGMVRRGYLKGLGEARGCKYPARPKPQ